MSNFLTNFSNGMATITRSFPAVRERQKLTIPFKKNHLADAAATLAILGNVEVPVPPSWLSEADPQAALTLSANNLTKELLTKLSGADVEIAEKGSTHKVVGRLAGIEPFAEQINNTLVNRYKAVVIDKNGTVQVITDDKIGALTFTDKKVQAEIGKALDRNFQQLKPNSVFVDIELAPAPDAGKDDKPIYIQYTIPTSAWQPIYQLRLNAKTKKTELECSAKIDNPTDEDLNDYVVTAVVGDPITFETDVADVRKPVRQRVNIVSDQGLGFVGAEDDIASLQQLASGSTTCDFDDDAGGSRGAVRARRANNSKSVRAQGMAFAAAAPAACTLESLQAEPRAKSAIDVQASECGDFAVFTAKTPISIGANRSTPVQLFQQDVEGEVILLYNEAKDANRPFRAVKFKNTTPHSLGKGVCTVFNDDIFSGTCVLEAVKPNETKLLPHARENGVKVFKNPPNSGDHRRLTRTARIEISKGIAIFDQTTKQMTTYRIQNSKNEAFTLEVEHSRTLPESTLETTGNDGEPTTLANGIRVPVKLPANGTVEVKITETSPSRERISLSYHNGPDWLRRYFLDVANGKAASNKKVKAILEIQEELFKANQELQTATQQCQALQREQARKIELVKALNTGTEADRHRGDLSKNEDEISKAEKTTIPELQKKVQEVQEKLDEALKALSASWVEGGAAPVR
jgi:hypothetical protein